MQTISAKKVPKPRTRLLLSQFQSGPVAIGLSRQTQWLASQSEALQTQDSPGKGIVIEF